MKKRIVTLLIFLIALPCLRTTAAQLLNISTRAVVLPGEFVLIGGFIITGSEPKEVILRALGPSLPVGDFAPHLSDPVLELHMNDGTVVTNDDWRDTQEGEILDTGIPPPEELESAMVVTLPPGAHTAVLRGKGEDEGIALVEVYDLNQAADSLLANISSRGLVLGGANVMIAGVIVGPDGSGAATVVFRGLGPSLSDFGIQMPLSNPTLTVFNKDGVVLGMNDDWMDGPNATEIAALGLAPQSALEAAFQASFIPGEYTAILSNSNSVDGGVGLVEAYGID
jgi:hypothetical protein